MKSVAEKDLAKLYANTDAFVCTSLHEGFCIPIVEALASGVPVFALQNSAIPETLGKAGVQLQTQEPAVIAQIIFEVLQSKRAKDAVLASQAARLEELEQEQSIENLQRKIVDLLSRITGRQSLRQSLSYV